MRAITDASQSVIWRWDSAPFGDTLPEEDPDGDDQALRFNLRFPGQYFDQETNLHCNTFRDYDPTTGRYVQSNPIGLDGGINTYAYVDGSPLPYFDPEGLQIAIPAPIAPPIGGYNPSAPSTPDSAGSSRSKRQRRLEPCYI
ncbi:MAG: RHS repeat-associated core domain-containing protein [Candidatus Competibacteraceae bacterium]|nr:RHS repeat-associated core domain-containing protein [Candidatus Competibacteraceae bacterium]